MARSGLTLVNQDGAKAGNPRELLYLRLCVPEDPMGRKACGTMQWSEDRVEQAKPALLVKQHEELDDVSVRLRGPS